MKQYKLRKLQAHRHFVHGRYLVGIDPAKDHHQVQILVPDGLPIGATFSFKHSFAGFHHQLWKRLAARLPQLAHLPRHQLSEHLVFAVETRRSLPPATISKEPFDRLDRPIRGVPRIVLNPR